ncbi:hypothetical protein TD95_003827 [Thielaviopsis punctulata]|uniref:DUF7029 domain-containing protein n=1 Tax=Thielaviopsis punctulata TaxID=72032 RepID=A0A0F4ZIF5_9PEZI|nr:hypothetical protein TD95_003827 [Thielaviopsis punctulata]
MPAKTNVPVAAADVEINANKVAATSSSSTKKGSIVPTKVSISKSSPTTIKTSIKTSAKATSKTSAKTTAKATSKVTSKVTSKATSKTSAKTTAKATSRVTSKVTSKATSKTSAKTTAKATSKVTSKTSAAPKVTVVPTSVSLSAAKPSTILMTSANLSLLPEIAKTSLSLAPTASTVLQPTVTGVPKNTTQNFVPIKSPQGNVNIEAVDAAPVDASLKTNITMHYGSDETADKGKIGMNLNMTAPAVMLETVEGISSVACTNSSITVKFSSAADYTDALSHWSKESNFAVITNNGNDCDLDQERGFFKATKATGDAKSSTITLDAARAELSDIASNLEMTFDSIPAGALTKRTSANDLLSFGFAKALPNDTVLFDDNKYVKVVADEAWFTTNITFSGKMNFNFWHFKMEQLYFDIDVDFESEAAMSAEVKAKYMQVFKYAPKDLSFTLVAVPGIITLGPGVQFGLGAEIDVDAAVNAKVDLGFAVPEGKVHLDMVNFGQSSATGWNKPVYHASANISQGATAVINPSLDLSVQFALKLLGGIVDLSSGFTISPSMFNTFKLVGSQGIGIDGTGSKAGADVSLPASCAPDMSNGVALKSDLVFNMTGFVTKYWEAPIMSLDVPIIDSCWSLPKINGTLL